MNDQEESMHNHLKLVLVGFYQPCCWSKVKNQVHQLVVQLIDHVEQFGAAENQLESMYDHLKMVLAGFSANLLLAYGGLPG